MSPRILSLITLLALGRILASALLGFDDSIPFVVMSPLPKVFQADSFFAKKKITFYGTNGEVFQTDLRYGSPWPFHERSPHDHFIALKILDRPLLFSEKQWKTLAHQQFCNPARKARLNARLTGMGIHRISLVYKSNQKMIRQTDPSGGMIQREVICAENP